jgi:hypothetical protein
LWAILLEDPVVGAEQIAQPRRVARAAQILEQQRIEQRATLIVGKAKLLADLHPDHGGAHRVAHGLALGEVERIGKRPEDFGQPDPGIRLGVRNHP